MVIKNKYVWLYSLLLLCLKAVANPALTDVLLNPVDGAETRITLTFSDSIKAEPVIRISNQPAMLELIFTQAQSGLVKQQVPLGQQGVTELQAIEQGDNLKLVLKLEQLMYYKSQLFDKQLVLQLSNKPLSVATLAVPNNSAINKIESIDFRRGKEGEANLLVFLTNSTTAFDIQESGGKIKLEFHNTEIMDDLLYRMDVKDFGTLVHFIESFRDSTKARLEVEPDGEFEYDYKQMNNLLTLTVKKPSRKVPGLTNKVYTGEPISLNFQDIPIRTVLQIIADYNGFNLVTSDTVGGNVTLRLDGVPWDQALDMLLRVKGLDKRMEGKILLVAPSDELSAREARDLQAKQQVKELSPLYSEFVRINYAKATELAELLKSGEAGIMSERGTVSVDERTNTLLLKDTTANLTDVKRILKVLDIPVKQVIIESRMVTVKDNISEEIGVRWGFSDQQGDDGVSGSLEGAETISGGSIPELEDRLNVNLPAANAAGTIGFHVAKLSDGTLLDLELSALESENKGEIIASPRITTANQQEAYIEQGTEIPYVESASSGATSVTFKKAVLGLRVTPHVTPDNRIVLDLVITQDNRGDIVQTPTGQAVAIDTQEISTQVLVDNGETIVLGGIYQQQIINAISKVPLLGDIPYLGWFFRRTSEFNEKKELLIFVTPRIVTEKL